MSVLADFCNNYNDYADNRSSLIIVSGSVAQFNLSSSDNLILNSNALS